jgi:hypothetical protein
MKKTLQTLVTILTVAFITSCKLDSPDFSGAQMINSSESYQPVTKGSYWKYKTDFGGIQYTETITMTGGTTTFGGRRFYDAGGVSSVFGNAAGYFYVNDHTYITRSTSYVQDIAIDLTTLKDNVPVGTTWTASVTDNGMVEGYPAKMVGTIMEKNITKIVNGKTFTNVIHTSIDLQYDLGGGFQSMTTYEMYYAKGVGYILGEYQVMGLPFGGIQLIEYSIK